MGRAHVLNPSLVPGPGAGQARLLMGPQALAQVGANLQVEVATASAYVNSASQPVPRQSLVVWAHLDTGASHTSISPALAQHVQLTSIGLGPASQTANGLAPAQPAFAIDLVFVGTSLTSKTNLRVASLAALPFSLQQHQAAPTDPRNFGVLIGRDVMSTWHLMWDGPMSMVIVSD
jgi:hypothetical protein